MSVSKLCRFLIVAVQLWYIHYMWLRVKAKIISVFIQDYARVGNICL